MNLIYICVFIDANHSYECCKSDIINSIKQFSNLKYIIFDDYGVWEGVKKVIDEMMQKNILIFERFIGLINVPGPNGIVENVNEGIICRLNFDRKIMILDNKSYSWQNNSITFLANGQMNAFGRGNYKYKDIFIIQADFGGRQHILEFNHDYTEFISTRYDDNEIVRGQLLNI